MLLVMNLQHCLAAGRREAPKLAEARDFVKCSLPGSSQPLSTQLKGRMGPLRASTPKAARDVSLMLGGRSPSWGWAIIPAPSDGSEKTSPDAYWPSRGARSTRTVWTNKLKLERQQLPAPPIGTKQFQPLRHRTTLSGRRVELDLDGAVLRVAGPPQNPALTCTPARGVGPPIR